MGGGSPEPTLGKVWVLLGASPGTAEPQEQNLDLPMANESNETSLGNPECSVSVNELHCTEIGWEVKISI